MIRPPVFTLTVTGGVWRLFLVACVLICIVCSVFYWNLLRVRQVARAIEHTETVERELRSLGEDLLNAETGQRGFLLTRDEAYLVPYHAGVASARDRIARLYRLIANTQVRSCLERMEPVIEAKLAVLANTVSLARGGRQNAALAIVRQGNGKRLMDEFRRLRGEALDMERNLLMESRVKFLSEFNIIFIAGVVGGGAAILLLFLSAARTAGRLKRPIVNLLDGIRAMEAGDLTHRVAVVSHDEIGQVTQAFNKMADHTLTVSRVRDAVQEELRRSNADLDNFAYVASHDLKAPLRGIRNLAEWITEDLPRDATEETRENLHLLRSRVDRLDGLLESLLTYSRVGRDKRVVEQVDTCALVAEIVEYLAPRPGFRVVCQGEVPVLVTCKAPLEQVLRNLINNALKHHDGETGQVTVTNRDRGARIEFCVADDGPGIAPEFHDRIFQMFQTLKPRDQVEGSGMGLAIVRKTIETFGGSVRVEAPPTGRGTAFIFDWPTGIDEGAGT